jgi:hypothetical protein
MRGLALALLSGFLAATPVVAANGAIPIWQPTTITQSGSYVLTRNFRPTEGIAITIAANNVDIDLNGFSIEGDHGVYATGVTGLSIHDGTIGWEATLMLSDVSHFELRRVRLVIQDGSANLFGDHGVMEDCLVVGHSGSGVHVDGRFITLRNNHIEGDPVVVDCEGCRVIGNVISGAGLRVSGSGNVIADNVVTGSTEGALSDSDGILVHGHANHLESNVLTGRPRYGLRFSPTSTDNVYRGNTARENHGTDCSVPAVGGDFCDEGVGNTSAGDNFLPDER